MAGESAQVPLRFRSTARSTGRVSAKTEALSHSLDRVPPDAAGAGKPLRSGHIAVSRKHSLCR